MFSPLCLSVVLSTEVDRAKVLPRLDEHRLALRGGQVEAEALPADAWEQPPAEFFSANQRALRLPGALPPARIAWLDITADITH